MNVFLYELKTNKKSLIIWSITLSVIFLIFMLIYPAFSSASDEFMKVLNSFPKAVRDGLGISSNFFTLLGFYSYIFTYIVLIGAIYASNLGISIISKEQSNKTSDFLLTKPISRSKLFIGKYLAGLTNIFIMFIVISIVSLISLLLIKDNNFDYNMFFKIDFILLYIGLTFYSLGILIGIIKKRVKSVPALSLQIVFLFYIINVISLILDEDKLRLVTPFRYIETDYILTNSSYELSYLLLGLFLIITFNIISFINYNKKDIYI